MKYWIIHSLFVNSPCNRVSTLGICSRCYCTRRIPAQPSPNLFLSRNKSPPNRSIKKSRHAKVPNV